MRIDLAGYGPGSSGLTTLKVRQALEEAELIITSERLAGYVRNLGRTDAGCTEEILIETNSSEICRILEDPQEKIRGLNCLMKLQTGREFPITAAMADSVNVYEITVPVISCKMRKK